MIVRLVLALCYFTCVVLTQKDLPSYFPRCYRNDPNLSSCLQKATEVMRPYLQKGIPELDIIKISPFEVTSLTFGEDSELANFTATLSNVHFRGLDTYKFRSLEFDPKKLILSASVQFDLLDLRSNFTVDGKIIGVKVEGAGGVAFNISHSNGTFKQQCKLILKRGENYLEPKSIEVAFVLGTLTYDYSGLYADLPRFRKIVDAAIQEYDYELLDRLRPAFEKAVGSIANEFLFKKLYKVPYNKLLPEH